MATKSSTPAPRPFAPNASVVWKDGMRPVAHPHARGTVFLSSKRETYVIWEGETRPQVVFTGALMKG